MKLRIPARLTSINVKLFLSFWLITFVSVITTRFVFQQLTSEELVVSINRNDDTQLLRMATKLSEMKKKNSLQQFIERTPKRFGKYYLIKDLSSNKVIAFKSGRYLPFVEYINGKTFTDKIAIRLSFGRITGPANFSHQNKQYQLFIADRAPPPHIGTFYLRLPAWLQIIIPIIVSFALCWLLARTLSKPIYRIKSAATKFGDGDYSARADNVASRQDELGSLATSFNQMASKIESNVTAQKRLIADVSHELRSPMTRLQLALGLAQKSAKSPEDFTKYLERCETEVQRLDQMIDSVLSLSKLENALYSLKLETTNLNSLINHIVDDAQFVADDKSVIINLQCTIELIMPIDVQLITSAITNVLSNAIKYSTPNSSITIKVVMKNGQVIIKISDSGCGVPEQSLPQLFEPFYRVADARERKTGGTGLGLAIAKQAVTAHQGTIFAANNKVSTKAHANKKDQGKKDNQNNGLTVTLTLPIVNLLK